MADLADLGIEVVGSVFAIGALMWVCAAWCDVVLWAVDAVQAGWRRVRECGATGFGRRWSASRIGKIAHEVA